MRKISLKEGEVVCVKLDEAKYTLAQMRNINNAFPQTPIYAKIERFVPREVRTSDLFFCIEIRKLVCTEAFREEALSAKLYGIDFVPIDQNKHDPWG